MPRGGHKRLRPRRRRSYSSVGNTSGCRHRTRSTSRRRTLSPSVPLLYQPWTIDRVKQEAEEQPQQPSDKHYTPEDAAGQAPHDISVWGGEQVSRAAQQQLPITATARHHADATPTPTLSSAVSAESSFSPCSTSRTLASTEQFSNPVAASDEALSSGTCPITSPHASAAVLPVALINASSGFSSARITSRTAPDSVTPVAAALPVADVGAMSSTLPGGPPGTPYDVGMGEKHAEAAAAGYGEGVSSNGAALGHSQMTGTAVRLRTEEDKDTLRAASDATSSSSTFLPPEGAEHPVRNCACLTGHPSEDLWCSAAEGEGQKCSYADRLSVRRSVPGAAEGPGVGTAPLAAAGMTSDLSMNAATPPTLPAGNSASAVACPRSVETPLLNFLEARGKVISAPQQRAKPAASQEWQEQQPVAQSAAAGCTFSGALEEPRILHRGGTAVEAENASCRLACGNSSKSTAAVDSRNGNSRAISSRSLCFHSFCLSSSSVSIASRSPPAACSILAASPPCLGPSTAGFCGAASPTGTRSDGAPAADAAAAVSVGEEFAATEDFAFGTASAAAFAAVGRRARELRQVIGGSEASSSSLLRDISDAATHPPALLQPQQPSMQRPRRMPVFRIAGGTCQRLLLQTPELLRLVHCHNPRGNLEDAVDGALKLRDLRQVVGRHGMQRPSIEVRRNCVLVNLPFVRAILLHACVVLLPPADFSSVGYSPFVLFKKKRQQQHPWQQQQQLPCMKEQQQLVGEALYEQQEDVRGQQREQVEWSLQKGESQEGAWKGRQQIPWERQLVREHGVDVVDAENREHQQTRQHQNEARGTMTSSAGNAGDLLGATRQRCENQLISSSSGGWAATCRSFWTSLCCRRQPHRPGGSPGPISSSYGSNNGHSDYTYLWAGEPSPLDLRSYSCRGASLRDAPTQQYPFSCAQRKIHPLSEEEQKHSNGDPVAGVSPASVLEDWLEGSEDGVYLEQQHRLIVKLMRITAANTATTAAAAPAGPAATALSGPAECAAFEAILEHVCDGLTAELEPIAEAAACVLRVIHEQPSSTRKLRKVADLRRRLDSIKSEARGADDALRSLLDSEDHLRRLEVSRFWGGEDAAAEWLRPSRSASSQDIEMLLESYEQELDALLKGIVRTEEALDDALQLMELHLASIRNAFLKSEIALDVVGVVFGGIAAVASVFGMNIRSGWEDKENTFWTLAGSLCLLSCITCCLVYVWFRRQKL